MKERSLLFAIFILIEVALLVEFGRSYGTASVMAEVIISAFAGWLIIQNITRLTGMRARLAIWTMQLPGQHLIKSFMTLIGGIVLIVPGFLSDSIGILLILPITQKAVYKRFQRIFPKIF